MIRPRTLFDKIWDAHTVRAIEGGPVQLYIDRHYCHEVTSPQAFDGLRSRGISVRRPGRTFCHPDHNVPTVDQFRPVADPVAAAQISALERNAAEFGLTHIPLGDPRGGIIHVMGPENGLTLPGMTIVCGDSHTSTHGAFGAIAFGIGTSEVEMVLATQCVLQPRPKTMRITVNGRLAPGVTAKDMALYIIAQLTTSGATGHFVEYAGEAVQALSMEGRMTLCNMSIEMGARGGMVAPDQTTFDYVKGRAYAPSGHEWDAAVERWRQLPTDPGAVFDREVTFNAADITPRLTYGTNPGMGIGVDQIIPAAADASEERALEYMRFRPGERMTGRPVDYVFVGSCTNGRYEDFALFADVVDGRRKAPGVEVWLVPGSWSVLHRLQADGIEERLGRSGFTLRQPGCSACLAMNPDKIPSEALAVSTSNRNFEGRQGPGARTVLASIPIAAAAAVTGCITDPRTL